MNNEILLPNRCHNFAKSGLLRLYSRESASAKLFPLAYQIYLWCLQVANKGQLPSVSALKCAYFSPVSLVSERVSSFWPRVLSSHHGENRAFEAILLLWNDEDSLWCLTSGFWVGLFLCSRSELLWTKVSTGLQVIPPVSVLSIAHMIRNCNDAEKGSQLPFGLI